MATCLIGASDLRRVTCFVPNEAGVVGARMFTAALVARPVTDGFVYIGVAGGSPSASVTCPSLTASIVARTLLARPVAQSGYVYGVRAPPAIDATCW